MLFQDPFIASLCVVSLALLYAARNASARVRRALFIAVNALLIAAALSPLAIALMSALLILLFACSRGLDRLALSGWPRTLTTTVGLSLPLATLAAVKLGKLSTIAHGLRIESLAGPLDMVRMLGLSYLFFKAVHFLVECHRGSIRRPSFGTFLAYFFYFPTFLAGPMMRYPEFATRAAHPRPLTTLRLGVALYLLLSAGLKKFLIVPYLYPYASDYRNVLLFEAHWANIALSLTAYSGYIFCDFSGYSDAAIAASLFCGIPCGVNFRAPYLAHNLGDFWKRWHISLSTILRDYLFLPLTGTLSRAAPRLPRLSVTVLGYLVTFVLSGIWHGLNLGFVAWGAWHGCGLALHRIFRAALQALREQGVALPVIGFRPLSIVFTFSYVTVGWFWFAYPIDEAKIALGYAMNQSLPVPPKTSEAFAFRLKPDVSSYQILAPRFPGMRRLIELKSDENAAWAPIKGLTCDEKSCRFTKTLVSFDDKALVRLLYSTGSRETQWYALPVGTEREELTQ